MSVSGAYLAATINGVEGSGLHQWECQSGGTALNATTGKGRGFTDTDVGPRDARVTLRLRFDLVAGVGWSNIQFGTVVDELLLYRNANDQYPAYEFPEAIVIEDPETVEVEGECELTLVLKNKGTFSVNRY